MTKLQNILNQILKSSLGLGIIGSLFLGIVIGSMFLVYIKPYEYGVKQINIGLNRGIQSTILTTGFHIIIPFGIQEIHRFPKNIQIFDLTNTPRTATGRIEKAAYIQTSDGFYVEVDVSIIYKITDPVKVIKSIGPGKLYEDNGIIPKAEPILKDTLGQLTTEEFYNSSLRVNKMLLAKQKLNNELNQKGIEIDHVLVRYFKYSNEIQRNIEDKKLKDQLVFKNQAEARAASEAANLAKVIEEGEALVKIELEKGKAYVKKQQATKELYVRRKKAQGDLLVKLAEAEKTRLKNRALQTPGSKNLVGLEMAKVYKGVEVIILPSDGKDGLNPLNLNKVLEMN